MRTAPAPAGASHIKADSYWSKLALHKVPSKYLLMAAFASYITLAISYLQGVPAWLAFGIALLPWVAIVFVEMEWSYKHFGWFALFGVMAFVQTIHYSEHCIEVIQVHFFHDPVSQAQAIFSALNIEWVHFVGDTGLTIGTLLLLWKFPRNPWLWVAIPFQIAHQAEHTFLLFNYLFEGAKGGGPGLLASPGGAIAGGVGLNRPDLHWIYNTLYTIPFVLALIFQLKRTYDESLDEVFPEAPKADLMEASRHLESFQYAPTETVLSMGDEADRMYIIVDGEAGEYGHDENGQFVEMGSLHHGQYFGQAGLLVPGAGHPTTIRAKTHLTVLAMDAETFQRLMAESQAVAANSPVAVPAPRGSNGQEAGPGLVTAAASAPRSRPKASNGARSTAARTARTSAHTNSSRANGANGTRGGGSRAKSTNGSTTRKPSTRRTNRDS